MWLLLVILNGVRISVSNPTNEIAALHLKSVIFSWTIEGGEGKAEMSSSADSFNMLLCNKNNTKKEREGIQQVWRCFEHENDEKSRWCNSPSRPKQHNLRRPARTRIRLHARIVRTNVSQTLMMTGHVLSFASYSAANLLMFWWWLLGFPARNSLLSCIEYEDAGVIRLLHCVTFLAWLMVPPVFLLHAKSCLLIGCARYNKNINTASRFWAATGSL